MERKDKNGGAGERQKMTGCRSVTGHAVFFA